MLPLVAGARLAGGAQVLVVAGVGRALGALDSVDARPLGLRVAVVVLGSSPWSGSTASTTASKVPSSKSYESGRSKVTRAPVLMKEGSRLRLGLGMCEGL